MLRSSKHAVSFVVLDHMQEDLRIQIVVARLTHMVHLCSEACWKVVNTLQDWINLELCTHLFHDNRLRTQLDRLYDAIPQASLLQFSFVDPVLALPFAIRTADFMEEVFLQSNDTNLLDLSFVFGSWLFPLVLWNCNPISLPIIDFSPL